MLKLVLLLVLFKEILKALWSNQSKEEKTPFFLKKGDGLCDVVCKSHLVRGTVGHADDAGALFFTTDQLISFCFRLCKLRKKIGSKKQTSWRQFHCFSFLLELSYLYGW